MVVRLDGETIVGLKPVMGYLHRNHEKIAESTTYLGSMPFTDRLDYFCSMTNNWAYALTVEKLAGLQVPERAEYLRVILAELTRSLDILTADADEDAYRDAVITRNVLGKVTESTRSRTYRHLRELYGLSLSVPLFAILRQLHQVDPQSLPQLAVLVAWARDPQLRATSDAILRSRPDQPVAVDALEEAAMPILSGQYNRKSIHNIAKNAHSADLIIHGQAGPTMASILEYVKQGLGIED